MSRVIWVFALLLGTGVLAAFGLAESGSTVGTLAADTVAASDATPRDGAVQAGAAAFAAAIRGLTAVITAVSRSWWWPLEATLELVQNTVRRGWSAIHRLSGPSQARP